MIYFNLKLKKLGKAENWKKITGPLWEGDKSLTLLLLAKPAESVQSVTKGVDGDKKKLMKKLPKKSTN
jgi:hypothetical protein